jgi:hypothetical protein
MASAHAMQQARRLAAVVSPPAEDGRRRRPPAGPALKWCRESCHDQRNGPATTERDTGTMAITLASRAPSANHEAMADGRLPSSLLAMAVTIGRAGAWPARRPAVGLGVHPAGEVARLVGPVQPG